MAANIDEAIATVAGDILVKISAVGDSVLPSMRQWIQLAFTNENAPNPDPNVQNPDAWDRQSLDQGTVYDWAVPSLVQLQKMTEGERVATPDPGFVSDNVFLSVNQAIDTVSRALYATKFARINQRITQAQEDQIVAVYTAVWE